MMHYEGRMQATGLPPLFQPFTSVNGPHRGGGTQDTDFTNGFTKGISKDFPDFYRNIGFKNSGLTLEFRSLVGTGRSGWMIGSLSGSPG